MPLGGADQVVHAPYQLRVELPHLQLDHALRPVEDEPDKVLTVFGHVGEVSIEFVGVRIMILQYIGPVVMADGDEGVPVAILKVSSILGQGDETGAVIVGILVGIRLFRLRPLIDAAVMDLDINRSRFSTRSDYFNPLVGLGVLSDDLACNIVEIDAAHRRCGIFQIDLHPVVSFHRSPERHALFHGRATDDESENKTPQIQSPSPFVVRCGSHDIPSFCLRLALWKVVEGYFKWCSRWAGRGGLLDFVLITCWIKSITFF